MPQPAGVRRRILVTIAALTFAFAVASGLSLAQHLEVHGLLEDVSEAQRGIDEVLRLANAVRAQHLRLARRVALGDWPEGGTRRALPMPVREALAAAALHVREPQERADLEGIEAVAEELQARFAEVGSAPDRELAMALQADALALMERLQQHVEALTARLERGVHAAARRAQQARDEAQSRTALFLLVVLMLAAGLGLLIDRSITVPLRQLEAGARRLATGDLSTRIELPGDDEFASLAQRFNEMAGELAEHQERLVQSEKLAGVGRLAAGIAHELNNPLGVILGYARLIERSGGAGAADAAVIADEVGRCQTIVAGLLDLSRPPRLSPVALDLVELVRETTERLRAAGCAAQVAIEALGDMIVEADGGAVRQILWNLLRNAAEAAPGVPVDVRIVRDGPQVRLSVSDHGRGVPPWARPHLFEPFFTTKARGTGLGLAVSAALARAHGGALYLAEPADGQGEGACFELSLPVTAPPRAEADSGAAAQAM